MAREQGLRVLIIDDVEDDALLAEEGLRRGGYTISTQRVDTAAALEAALTAQPWDLILCDYSMPHFSGMDALALVRQHDVDLPFILRSGTVGEEIAVAALQAGADDYVMKGNPARLVPSVQRVLREADERRRMRQAEDALRASEALFRSLVETSPDAIALLDLQGSIQMANQQAATLYHHTSPQALIGHHALELLVPADRDRAAAALSAVAAGAVTKVHAYTAQRPDGTTFFLELQSTLVYAGVPGAPDSIMIIARDVTERTQAAARLSFQAHLLETVSQAIIATDVDGVITYWNRAAETLYGWASAEVVDRNILSILPTEPLCARDAESLASVGAGDPSSGDYLAHHRSGRVIPIHAAAAPVHDEGGVVVGSIGVSTDIGARVQADERLLAERDLLRTLMDTVPDGLYVKDRASRFLRANTAQARALGAATPEEMVGRTDFDYYPPALAEQFASAERHLLATGEPLINELEDQSSRGQGRRWILSSKVPILEQGQITGLVGISRDITAFRKIEEERERFFTLSLDLLCVAGMDGMYKSVNPAFERTLGYTLQDLSGARVSSLIHPDDLQGSLTEIARLVTGVSSVGFENRYRCKDGTYRRLQWTCIPVPAEGLLYATAHDITASKEAEEQLQFQAHLLNTVGQAVTSTDPQGIVTYWNRSAENLYGWSAEEALGKHLREVIPAPDAYAQMDTNLARVADGRELSGEQMQQHRDGHTFPAMITVTPVLDAHGAVIGAVGIGSDITRQKAAEEQIRTLNTSLEQRVVERTAQMEGAIADLQVQMAERQLAEEALRASELRFRSVTQSALDAILAADDSGTIIAWNSGAQALFGYAETEMLGRPLTLLMPERYRVAHRQGLARFLATGEAHVIGHVVELGGLRRDGSEFPLELSLATWSTEAGTFFSAILRDLTERKRAEAALQQAKEEAERANAAKSEFLSRMSHELRTPLNAILGFGQLLEMRDLGPRGDEGVGYILKAGRHLLGLIDEVLDISRIEAGRLTLSLEPVDVVGSVGGVLDLARPLAAARHIQLVNEVTPLHGWYLQADQQRLTQVLLNLVSNAIKYNRDGGQVTISAVVREDTRLRLLVRDTGAGLHAEELARLFVPFERLGAAQAGIEGTGIGLALARQLVEAMGGTIGVESVVGEGSTFWVDLPLAESPLAQQSSLSPVAAVAAAAPVPARIRTVLYVEDNLSNIALIEHLVSQVAEVRLLTAMQGSLGLELAREHTPDLILLDLHLPDMQGDEVLRRLQADPQTRDIPVVMLSADALPRQIARLREAGAAAYLTKPLDVKRFLATLEEILTKRKG